MTNVKKAIGLRGETGNNITDATSSEVIGDNLLNKIQSIMWILHVIWLQPMTR